MKLITLELTQKSCNELDPLKYRNNFAKFEGIHSDVVEDWSRLGCYTILVGKELLMFCRAAVPMCSGESSPTLASSGSTVLLSTTELNQKWLRRKLYVFGLNLSQKEITLVINRQMGGNMIIISIK